MASPKLGFIGFGTMAQAIQKGAKTTLGTCYFHDRNPKNIAQFSNDDTCNYLELEPLISSCDIILIAVKPQHFEDLYRSLPPTKNRPLWVSVMAGITLHTLQAALGEDQSISRVMPNTPLLVSEGASAGCYNAKVSNGQKQSLRSIFSSCGKYIEVDESQMNAVTAVSGSGPAFFASFLKAISEKGMALGLDKKTAVTLAVQTMKGTATLLENTDAATLIKNVASPGGTTEAGLKTLNDLDIEDRIQAVVQKTFDRSIEMGQKKS